MNASVELAADVPLEPDRSVPFTDRQGLAPRRDRAGLSSGPYVVAAIWWALLLYASVQGLLAG
jgi:hypothetical protein